MKQSSWLVSIVAVFTMLAIAYRIQIILKPSFSFITISRTHETPKHLVNAHVAPLTNYSQALTEKIYANLNLDFLIKPEGLYKIIPIDSFDPTRLDNCITLSALDRDSQFIHASYGTQVLQTLKKYFQDNKDILIVEFDETLLKNVNSTLKNEQNKPDGEFFPHIYGTQKIPLSAIRTIIEINNIDGAWVPENITLVVPCSLNSSYKKYINV
jgi:uncharacterized protein (DUF952 family)